MKKIFLIIFTIFILMLLIFFSVLYINKSKKLSKSEFIELLKSFEKVDNVKIEDQYSTKYIKNGYTLVAMKDGIYTWSNAKNKECISYCPDLKEYTLLPYSEFETSDFDNASYKFIRL